MDMMAEAVESSLDQLDKKSISKSGSKRPAGYSDFKRNSKLTKTSFGFDDDELSDSSDEEVTSKPVSSNSQKVPSSGNSENDQKTSSDEEKSNDLEVPKTLEEQIDEKIEEAIKNDEKVIEKIIGDAKIEPPKSETPIEKQKPTSFPPIMMKSIKSVDELLNFDRAHLSNELKRRSCKAGGTQQQLAERLFAIKGLSKKNIPKKFRAKN